MKIPSEFEYKTIVKNVSCAMWFKENGGEDEISLVKSARKTSTRKIQMVADIGQSFGLVLSQ